MKSVLTFTEKRAVYKNLRMMSGKDPEIRLAISINS